MHGKSTFYLLIAVLVLGGYITLVEKNRLTTGEARALARRAFRIEPETITYLRMERGGIRVECTRKEEGWYLVRPEGARARDELVESLLLRLEKVEKGAVLSEHDLRERNSSLAEFGLDKPQAVLVFGNDLAQRIMHVGRATPLGTDLYVKEVNRPDIITVSSDLLRLIPKSASVLRVRTVFAAQENDITEIEMSRPEGLLKLHREPEGDWQIAQPRILRAHPDRVAYLLQHLLALRVDEFVRDDSDLELDWEVDTILKVTLLANDRPLGLWVRPRSAASEEKVYARLDTVDSVFTLPLELEKILKLPLDDLSDYSLYATVPAAADSLVLKKEGKEIHFANTKGTWSIIKPVAYPVEGDMLQRLFDPWKNKNMLRLLSTTESRSYTTPDSVPVLEIDIAPASSGDAASATPWTLKVFKHSSDEQRLVFQLPQQRVWGEMAAPLLDQVAMDVLSWRSPLVLEMKKDAVIRITRTLSDEVQIFRRTPEQGSWLLNDLTKVDRTFVNRLLHAVCHIKTKRWVVDADTLEPFGLGPDAVRIAVGLSGDESVGKTLLIGAAAETGGRYATLLGDEAVFTIDPELAEAFLAPVKIVSHAENTVTNTSP